MRSKPVLSSVQLFMMALGSALVFPYTFMPILVTPPANQDVWIVLLFSFAFILVINAPLLFLMNKFRGMNINRIQETIFGKFLGKIASVFFVLFFLYCFTACMLISAMFINIYIFPETPVWALIAYMIVPVAYAAYKGAGPIGRIAVFIVPTALLMVIVFLLAGIGTMDMSELKPVLADSTFGELTRGAFFTAARYSEILIFFVFSFFLNRRASINKTYTSALIAFGLSYMAMLIPTMTVLGHEFAKHTWNPFFVFTRQVDLMQAIERMQALTMLAWFPMALLKLIMYCYMASYVFSNTVGARSHKPFVFPFAFIACALCLLPVINKSSTMELLRSDTIFPWVILPVIFVIPLLLCVVYRLRKKQVDLLIPRKPEIPTQE